MRRRRRTVTTLLEIFDKTEFIKKRIDRKNLVMDAMNYCKTRWK